MLGRHHAAMGAAAGVISAPVLGGHTVPAQAAAAVLGAVGALIPDLDHPGSMLTRALGPVGWVLCRILRLCSHVLYRATKGPRDELGDGEHRHASHTVLFAVLVGALAYVGCLVAGRHGAPLPPLLVGGTLAVGCFVHCLGDSCTVAGCPWLFPLPIAGETWYEIRLPWPFRFRTGHSWREPAIAYGSVAVAVMLYPGAWPVVVHAMQVLRSR